MYMTNLEILEDVCLISKEPIIDKITLQCKHSYEYYYLYEEIKQQKNRHKNYFKCPYCRTKYIGTIPYYEITDVEKINYINHNNKLLLPLLKCSFDKCTLNANKYKIGTFCIKHYKKNEMNSCEAVCKNGNRCKHKAVVNNMCNIHNNIKLKCNALCKNGNTCKKYALTDSNLCKIHSKKDNK